MKQVVSALCVLLSVCVLADEDLMTNGNRVVDSDGAAMLYDWCAAHQSVWTRKAADGGLAAAQCQMGLFYMNGLGVEQDDDKAVEWLNKAAAQNHAQAQYNLGIYYARFSDKESQRLAVKWLGEAAKQDYADAQYNLAQLYLNPHHPASSEQNAGRRAISLLRCAAAQGHAAAKAKLQELGITIPPSSSKK